MQSLAYSSWCAAVQHSQVVPWNISQWRLTLLVLVFSQVIKNHFASEYIYNKYKDLKTCDIIEDNPQVSTAPSAVWRSAFAYMLIPADQQSATCLESMLSPTQHAC